MVTGGGQVRTRSGGEGGRQGEPSGFDDEVFEDWGSGGEAAEDESGVEDQGAGGWQEEVGG